METTIITCPECGGVLMREQVSKLEYVCQIGHRYCPDGLRENHNTQVEAHLWKAYRILNERSDMLKELSAAAAAGKGISGDGHRYRKLAEETDSVAKSLKEVVERALKIMAKDHEILP